MTFCPLLLFLFWYGCSMCSHSVTEDHCKSPIVEAMIWGLACMWWVFYFVFSFFTFIPACDCLCSVLPSMLWRWGQLWWGVVYLSHSMLQIPAVFQRTRPNLALGERYFHPRHFWYCCKKKTLLMSSFRYACGNCYVLVNKTSILVCVEMCSISAATVASSSEPCILPAYKDGKRTTGWRHSGKALDITDNCSLVYWMSVVLNEYLFFSQYDVVTGS